MLEWKFINGITKESMMSSNEYLLAINAAFKSRATPFQSKYHVNTGALTQNNNVVFGSNHEMAITDTITHGEEAVIANALENYGPNDKIKIIAFLSNNEEEIGSPCGNCRDSIKQYTDLDNLIIINAPRNGGTATIMPGRAYFKNEYEEIPASKREKILKSIVLKEALAAEKIAYTTYLTQDSPNIYGAAIQCENGLTFKGSFRGNVAYHPSLPISSAISNFRDGSNNSSRKWIDSIIVASTSGIPEVMYKDRQDALEFTEAMQTLAGRSRTPLPIYLVNAKNGLESAELFETNSSEWLPFSFSPEHLGLADQVAKGYEKLFKD
jgi:cytidine deaminase